VSYDLFREEAIKKARSLNIPRSRFYSLAYTAACQVV
jgi:hypothetical protein